MSNKVVSATYRSIIDDVIHNVRQDFEEMGIEKEVLEELQRSWEARLVATGVADFEGAPVITRPPRKSEQKKEESGADGAGVKKEEDGDSQQNGNGNAAAGSSSSTAGPSGSSNKAAKTADGGDATANRSDETNGHPDANGNADDGSNGDAKAGEKRKQPESNSDEIGSDLDDSDDEADGAEGTEGLDGDTVLCLYEKVQRVRNRWKCVLKDGVANIDGRDYLFSRCNTEFEW